MTDKQVVKYIRISNLVLLAIALIIIAFNSIYSIQAQEQAVVTTFGNAVTVSSPGLHFKIPFVQNVTKVPTVIHGLQIGYNEHDDFNLSESLMITHDYNFVNVDFYVEYQVSDPIQYLYASSDPELILKNLAQSYIRDTIGLHDVDEVITTGKSEIQLEIKDKLTSRLEEENIGLQLINITIQDSEPPTEDVKNAFKAVETAKQGKEEAVNNARKYESEKIPAARADVNAILRAAEAEKEERVNDALAQVAVFDAMYAEYINNPQMTRQRMFYEAMEEILPNLTIIIDAGDGTTQRILPLNPFSESTTTIITDSENKEDK